MAENNSSAPLLPCPFCGERTQINALGRSWWRMESGHRQDCLLSEVDHTVPQTDEQKQLLIDAWNTRAPQAVAAQAVPAAVAVPEWDKVRRGLAMLMLGFAGRTDCTESAAEAVLDAATEPGMPLAGLRAALAATQVEVQAEPVDWDELPEDANERSMFDRNLGLYGGDPRVAIATALRLWANTRGNGSFGLMCAIYANEVAKMHIAAPQAQPADALTKAALDVLAERRRQVEVEGFTYSHDDSYTDGELAQAAACYAASSQSRDISYMSHLWPWPNHAWKPSTTRNDLLKAGALILAELECIYRARAAMAAAQEGGNAAKEA